MNNSSNSKRWQDLATSAAQGTLIERWRQTTEWWLGARERCYALANEDMQALRSAAQRWHDLAIRRLGLGPTIGREGEVTRR